MSKKALFITLSMGMILLVFSACQKNEGTTYQDVKPILSTSCAVSGCHDATTVRKNIDFTSYATMSGATGLKNALTKDANGFYDRVLVKQNMPPLGTLSQEDKDLLQGWVDNNFAEN